MHFAYLISKEPRCPETPAPQRQLMLSETLSDETLRLIAPGMAHKKAPAGARAV
ncbi:hypothetical protein HME01_11180 [Vreelandella aquamarina]|nr:hypothetical protein HME01_11180 [Halomonas meridiana]